MDKRARAELFRIRLKEAMARRQLNQSGLARASGLDRSTLSQLLVADEPRLPSGQALGEIASALQVSADWLLGLTSHRGVASEILEQAMQVTEAARHPVDQQVFNWMAEAAGSKVRHVPAGLPDIFKQDAVFDFEYAEPVRRTPAQAITDARDQLDLIRRPDYDLEICLSRQTIEGFARAEGRWQGLSLETRISQLEGMAERVDSFYPAVRFFAFDAGTHFSVPFSVYGQKRVAIYIGQRYLAFTATRYVREMSRHFDDLIRSATIHAHEMADWLAAEAKAIR